ncbi:MAG TPA: Ig-like domain-containing protein, partial [Verrucomicrobiae bacterium]|nr:Ig-like domain-containing protein [Verrucomicrobiae bacterium]
LCALSSANPSATLCSPANGSTVTSPVKIIAGTTDTTPVKLLQIYVDGSKRYEAALAAAYVTLALPAGSHRITAEAVDTSNRIFKKSVSVTVR